MNKWIIITVFGLMSLSRANEINRNIETSYRYDKTLDKSEYFEFYRSNGKMILHGIRLVVENVTKKEGRAVRIIKEEYEDGEVSSISDSAEIISNKKEKGKGG